MGAAPFWPYHPYKALFKFPTLSEGGTSPRILDGVLVS